MNLNRNSLAGDYLIDSPAPQNISYLWSFGSLLGLTLALLIASGISLAMHYVPATALAFAAVEEIDRALHAGWLLRFLHANAASFFFVWVYLHIARNLFYGSYRHPRAALWSIGVVLFVAMMATAFIGYVLPWGQMSLWGATVITNLLSAVPIIGDELVLFIWGGFSVDDPTLNRFFALHFLLPFLLAALAVLHLMALHRSASNNPEGIASLGDRVRFHPYFTAKDLVPFLVFGALLLGFVCFSPNFFGHPDNSIEANPLVTPYSIVPEWYFLPYYAILRAIPNKAGGVAAMGASLLALFALPLINRRARSLRFRPLAQAAFWIFCANFLFLLFLGQAPIAQPFILLNRLAVLVYFGAMCLLALGPLRAAHHRAGLPSHRWRNSPGCGRPPSGRSTRCPRDDGCGCSDNPEGIARSATG